jgi:hypothetical protein
VLYAVTVWGKCEDYPAVTYAAVLIIMYKYTEYPLGPVCFVITLISKSDIGTFWTLYFIAIKL